MEILMTKLVSLGRVSIATKLGVSPYANPFSDDGARKNDGVTVCSFFKHTATEKIDDECNANS